MPTSRNFISFIFDLSASRPALIFKAFSLFTGAFGEILEFPHHNMFNHSVCSPSKILKYFENLTIYWHYICLFLRMQMRGCKKTYLMKSHAIILKTRETTAYLTAALSFTVAEIVGLVFRKAVTTTVSNCVPEQRMISCQASSSGIACR